MPIQTARSGATVPVRLDREKGFTIVELAVTVTVAAILVAVAIPSFKNMTLTNKLSSAANDLVSSINAARMQAIKLNSSAQFCSDSASNNQTTDDLGKACASNTGAVYYYQGLDTKGNAIVPKLLNATTALTGPVQLSGHVVALRFSPQGIAYQAGTTTIPTDGTVVADICTSSMSTSNHRQILIDSGRIISVKTTSGTCP